MQIHLEKVRDQPFRWQEDLVFPLSDLDRPELLSLSTVEVQGKLSPLEQGFYLDLGFSYRQKLQCDRCLEDYEVPVEERLELMVVEGRAPDYDGEHHLQAEDLGGVYVEGGVLRTDPLVLEQVQIAVPMKPLCRDDCPGLCPSCGADLKSDACSCAGAATDSRWGALAALRDRLS